MLHLDPAGRHVTDTLELSRAAATRHAHASALRQNLLSAPTGARPKGRPWRWSTVMFPPPTMTTARASGVQNPHDAT